MVQIKVIAVGKMKESYFKEACDEYAKRLGAYAKISIIELAEVKLSDNPSQKEIANALEKEGDMILAAMLPNSSLVTLCIEGEKLSSEKLSSKLDKMMNQGASSFTFVIGSSYGIAESIKQKSVLKLSMSEMTFPHRLARVMLLEQLYRAFSITNGGKYHK